MEAQTIYNCIKTCHPELLTTICRLHKPCSTVRRCVNDSRLEVIDFDKIKDAYCESLHSDPMPSVDALAYSEKRVALCFVELKGWDRFLNNPYRKASVSEEEIKTQAGRYDLKGKLESSLRICQDLMGVPDCFEGVELFFVLVTDIEIESNPLESIVYNLSVLAETSSKWKDLCHKYLSKALDEVAIGDIRKFYLYCETFDHWMVNVE